MIKYFEIMKLLSRFNIIKLLTLACLLIFLSGCDGKINNPFSSAPKVAEVKPNFSQAEFDTAAERCEEFVQRELNPYTTIFDSWEKNERIVVEVGHSNSQYSSSYSVRLCVVYMEHGFITRLSVPSVFDSNRWQRE